MFACTGNADQTAYVLLPRQTENQQLSWDTVGLVFRPLPGDVAERIPDLNLYRTYQVTGQQARASLRSVDATVEIPRFVRKMSPIVGSRTGAVCA